MRTLVTRARRISPVLILVGAFLVSQGLNVLGVYGQGRRMQDLIDAQRLESIADCVEVREQARQDERESKGIRALATEDDAARQILIEELRAPVPSAEVLFQQDVATCRQLAGEERADPLKEQP